MAKKMAYREMMQVHFQSFISNTIGNMQVSTNISMASFLDS